MEGEYYQTKESVDEYIRLAKDSSGKQLIVKLKQFLAPDSHLLEIGSGPGTDWRILRNFYHVVGSDNSIEFLNHLSKNNPAGHFLKLNATTLDTDQSFDGIYSNKVLHHLSNDELMASIKRQSEILKSGGIICHSFWLGKGSEIFKGLFVKYHNKKGLVSYHEKFFDILLLEDYKEFEESDSILHIGRKKTGTCKSILTEGATYR